MVNTPDKKRFVLHHVWKTGGTELCRLARANGWYVPAIEGCSILVSEGWPREDYDLIGQESMIGNGPRPDFKPSQSNMHKEIEAHNVQWISIMRHPFSRSLSHYHHASHFFNNTIKNQTTNTQMKLFFQGHGCRGNGSPCHFPLYVPDQQTRWICGTAQCSIKLNLDKQDLMRAMSNIQKFDVVLILEDMNDPNSCTRLQMRHILNFTKVQILHELAKVNNSIAMKKSLMRNPRTKWEDIATRLTSQSSSNGAESDLSYEVLAELGLRNTFDLQLYGFARHRCEELAAQINATTEFQTKSHNHFDLDAPFEVQEAMSHHFHPLIAVCFIVVGMLQLLLMRPLNYRSRRA